MTYHSHTIIEALIDGGRCALAQDEFAPEPQPFSDTVAALEAAIALAVRAGELPPATDARALALLGAATVAGLELARWELGPGTDVLTAYDIFARCALSSPSLRDELRVATAWAS